MTIEEVDGFYVGEFHCPENRQSYWYDRVPDVVNQPETYMLPLEDGEPDYLEMLYIMEQNDWEQAFIRSDNWSDKINPRNGSRIAECDENEIRRTVECLRNHHGEQYMDCPMGDYIVLREWLDLSYCYNLDCRNYHPNEIRFFVEGGEIRSMSPSIEGLKDINIGNDCTFAYLRDRLKELEEFPVDQIIALAEEFTEYAWHMDFCLTTDMEWYFIDMGVDGVYWNGERWVCMSGHEPEIDEIIERKANEVLEKP